MKTRFLPSALSLAAFALLALTPPAKETTYKVDPQQSKLTWVGKKVTGEHNGTVPVTGGTVLVSGQKLKSAQVEANLRALTVADLTDAGYNAKLTTHLKSEDFFNVEKYPTARLELVSVTPKGGDQYDVVGKLTIKAITEEVAFPATVKIDGGKLTANAKVAVDRTKYDIKFRSKSFFSDLGDKAIHDDFTLDVALVATADGASAGKSSR